MGRGTQKSCLMCTVLQKNWMVHKHTLTFMHTQTHTREDIKQHQELSQLLAGLHHILLQH